MYFWRDADFKTLTEAANYASAAPAWAGYAQFCSLLEKGLRKDAFVRLESFIKSAAEWPLSERQKFVSWLYHFAYERQDDSHLLTPHPLRVRLLEPTLIEWIVCEPERGEPHRWIGDREHLEEAIRLDPADEIARERLVNWIISGIDYAAHELPHGYLGNPEEDLRSLEEAETINNGISNGETRSQYWSEISELRETINDYLRGRTEP